MIILISYVRCISLSFIIILYIFSSGCTENVKWVEFDTCIDLADYYYDENSVITISENIVQVRTRFDFTDEEFPLDESMVHFEFNCSENTYRMIESIDVHRDGITGRQGATRKRPVPPVSVYENLFLRVCKQN